MAKDNDGLKKPTRKLGRPRRPTGARECFNGELVNAKRLAQIGPWTEKKIHQLTKERDGLPFVRIGRSHEKWFDPEKAKQYALRFEVVPNPSSDNISRIRRNR